MSADEREWGKTDGRWVSEWGYVDQFLCSILFDGTQVGNRGLQNDALVQQGLVVSLLGWTVEGRK